VPQKWTCPIVFSPTWWTPWLATRRWTCASGLPETCAIISWRMWPSRWEVPHRAARYGWAVVPMDDALVEAAVDVGGRPWYAGRLPSKLYTHFLHSLATNLGATVHVRVIRGSDRHHMVEAAIKAVGLALRQALAEGDTVFSTKGSVKVERQGSTS
jgi:hypothetical protein